MTSDDVHAVSRLAVSPDPSRGEDEHPSLDAISRSTEKMRMLITRPAPGIAGDERLERQRRHFAVTRGAAIVGWPQRELT